MENTEQPKPAEPTAVVKQIAVTGIADTLKPAEPTFVEKWKIYLYPGLVWGGVALAWIVFVACKVNWRDMAQIGQFGDAMAPVALLGAALGLILTAVSVRVQSEDFKAQLEEMKDATRFQSRREIYDSIERLVERINEHRRASTIMAKERGVNDWDHHDEVVAETTSEDESVDPGYRAVKMYDLEVFRLYTDAVVRGNRFQRDLTQVEADLYAHTGADEPFENVLKRSSLLREASLWHSKSRDTYLRLSEPRAFL